MKLREQLESLVLQASNDDLLGLINHLASKSECQKWTEYLPSELIDLNKFSE